MTYRFLSLFNIYHPGCERGYLELTRQSLQLKLTQTDAPGDFSKLTVVCLH